MGRSRILIVSEHASARFGGEAALPLHYFRVLRARGYGVWLITHARTRDELARLFPGEERILYVEDTLLDRFMWRAGCRLPAQVAYFTVVFVSRLATQLRQRKLVRALIAQQGIDVIHQPIPVSPREPSMMRGFGVPVVIGPMNGGMQYPPSFRRRQRLGERWLLSAARAAAALLNWLMPGKRDAALLLVANERTRRSLSPGVCPRVVEVAENGVDLGVWSEVGNSGQETAAGSSTTFAFVGRLVDWKGVDLLLHAFKRARARMPMRLLVIGDGQERSRLEALARELGILAGAAGEPDGAFFTGWLSQTACARELQRADCLVLPSLFECGGAVVLEAMSMAKPVIATEWGGPSDYLDASCGVLVRPTGRDQLIEGFVEAMIRLASSPALRVQMGCAGRDKVVRYYDWEIKVDRMLELYGQARMFAANGTWRPPV